jgi:hypothetical protein
VDEGHQLKSGDLRGSKSITVVGNPGNRFLTIPPTVLSIPDPSEILALEFKGEFSAIHDLLGFKDYRYRLIDFPRSSPQKRRLQLAKKDRQRW